MTVQPHTCLPWEMNLKVSFSEGLWKSGLKPAKLFFWRTIIKPSEELSCVGLAPCEDHIHQVNWLCTGYEDIELAGKRLDDGMVPRGWSIKKARQQFGCPMPKGCSNVLPRAFAQHRCENGAQSMDHLRFGFLSYPRLKKPKGLQSTPAESLEYEASIAPSEGIFRNPPSQLATPPFFHTTRKWNISWTKSPWIACPTFNRKWKSGFSSGRAWWTHWSRSRREQSACRSRRRHANFAM